MRKQVLVFMVAWLGLVIVGTAAYAAEKRDTGQGPWRRVSLQDKAPAKDISSPPSPQIKADAVDLDFDHEIWGLTDIGEGYVYGPTTRRSGMTVVDIDLDGDNDFVFPSTISSPLLMTNLGSSSAFYPGGSKVLDMDPLPEGYQYSVSLAFADLTGNSLPDMVAVVQRYDPDQKGVVWFRNEGPVESPHFSYQGLIYTESQADYMPPLWVALADLNGDKLQDLFVAEAFTGSSAPYHRLFELENIGSATNPVFAQAVEIRALSNLMPERLETSKKQAQARGANAFPPPDQEDPRSAAKASYTYSLGDIDFADWNADGLLDFMFYDRAIGLFWTPNIGTSTAPAWGTSLGSNGSPRYDHSAVDGLSWFEGTFAVRENPESAKPGAEWSRDVFLSVGSRLKTYRFFTAEDSYRIVQQCPVAYPAGMGSAAFWDYDWDGDLDLFRMAVGSGETTEMLLFPNKGTPYAPAWAWDYLNIDTIALTYGGDANNYRHDLFCIADHDGVQGPDLFVQGQDARVRYAWAFSPANAWDPPTFELQNENYGDVVASWHTGARPHGLTLADFDLSGDGGMELLAAYLHDDGANIVLVAPDNNYPSEGGIVYDVPEILPAPDASWAMSDAMSKQGEILDPIYIESFASGDLNLDGRPDLLVSLSQSNSFRKCELHAYYNLASLNYNPYIEFEYAGRVDESYEVDPWYARMPSLADIDGDGDQDLFVGHQYPQDSVLHSYLRYYRNESDVGLHYVRFRVVAGREWPLTLTLTTHGGAQVETVAPLYDMIQNVSGGSLFPNAVYLPGLYAPTVDILETTDLEYAYDFPGEVRAFVDVLPQVGTKESKAILVVGGGAVDSLYPTFRDLTAYAYRVLISEGLPADNIRLLAPTNFDADWDGTNDVAGAPTIDNVGKAVTQWAPTNDPADPLDRLLVYMCDHGQRDRFHLGDGAYLEADDYDGWLDTIQAAEQGLQVTTLIDTCESGSFLDNLKGENRITMSSAGIGPIEGVALFDQSEYISFSLNFWTRIYSGDTYGKAFDTAKTAIQAINPLQAPRIDDDGDGVGNEGNDGLIADGVRPGADFDVKGAGVYIGEVAPSQTISSNQATLWLSDVLTSFPIEGAKAYIVPPNRTQSFSESDDEQPVSDLTSLLFAYNDAEERWEGSYSGFDQGGLYQIQYFVKTGGQYYASPRIGFVDRINIPDIWEADDSADAAPWMPINTVQGHNFHDANDEDWARFSSPYNESATIAVISPGRRCRPVVELYREADFKALGKVAPVYSMSSEGNGEEVVFTYSFSNSEAYFVRVRNYESSVYGEGTSYMLLVAVGTGGSEILPTTVAITVFEQGSNTPIENASISFDGRSVGSTANEGVALIVAPSFGNYTVAASKSGYTQGSLLLRVNNNFESATLYLQSSGTGTGPSAAFSASPTSGDAPLSVQFSDQSSAGSEAISSWQWTFGDGGSSTAQHPSHVYTQAGNYSVSLSVSTAAGSDTESKSSYIAVTGAPVTTGNMQVSVRDIDTQAAITTATLSLSPAAIDPVTENVNGIYQLTGIPAGSYTLSLTAPDYGAVSHVISISAGQSSQMTLLLTAIPAKGCAGCSAGGAPRSYWMGDLLVIILTALALCYPRLRRVRGAMADELP